MGRRLRVVLRYVAGTGLINQHYSHVAALALAAVLGAEVVLPPAMHRSSFEHIFSVRASLSPHCCLLFDPSLLTALRTCRSCALAA